MMYVHTYMNMYENLLLRIQGIQVCQELMKSCLDEPKYFFLVESDGAKDVRTRGAPNHW